MPLTVVIGAQWGDEGKGRIVDALAAEVEAVARFQGGPNAGHTVYLGKEKFILHLIPIGILNEHTLCLIGLGVAVDPRVIAGEMKELEARNIKIGQRLIIDPRCSLITPEHIERDLQIEQALGARKIGTTLRGIGPAFTDRTSRVGLRLGAAIESFTRGEDLGFSEEYTQKSIKLKPYLGDVSLILHRMLKEGKSVLAEGGQGTMLDLGLGTYPYVTASNTIAASAPTNLGLGPKCVDKVIGVLKAYVTRVGAGPFPTEMSEKQAEKIRRVGDEFGATTGRARRCGWFDGVVAKFAARVNGVEKWAVTKLDVLDGMEKIEVAVAYEIDGERTDDFPTDCEMLNRIKPIYQEFSGWNKSTREARKLADLPKEARAYLDFIAEFTNVELGIISVGYERKCMIIL